MLEEQPSEKRHRERLDDPVDEEGDEQASRPLPDTQETAEVDLQHHRVDHQPDEQCDGDVDPAPLAELEVSNRPDRPWDELAEGDADNHAERDPHRQVAFEDVEALARRKALDEIRDQRLDAITHPTEIVVAHRLRIRKIPIEPGLRREVRARVAAAHRHHGVPGHARGEVVETFGALRAEVDPAFFHEGGRAQVDLACGPRPGAVGRDAAPSGSSRERLGHLRPAGVLDADEQDVREPHHRTLGGGWGTVNHRDHRQIPTVSSRNSGLRTRRACPPWGRR